MVFCVSDFFASFPVHLGGQKHPILTVRSTLVSTKYEPQGPSKFVRLFWNSFHQMSISIKKAFVGTKTVYILTRIFISSIINRVITNESILLIHIIVYSRIQHYLFLIYRREQ